MTTSDLPATGNRPAVLVTGGTGFLARWCIIELSRRGYRVRTTVRDQARGPSLSTSLLPHLPGPGELSARQADLNSDTGWAEAVEGCEYVLHIASPFPSAQPKDPEQVIAPARDGTRRVIEAGLAAAWDSASPTCATCRRTRHRHDHSPGGRPALPGHRAVPLAV